VNRDGTYDVRYEDGDRERDVVSEYIRSIDGADRRDRESRGASTSSSSSYREGDKVEARFKGKTRWFKGTIDSVNRDGTYDVRYEDGDRERDVIAEHIRSIDGADRRDRESRGASTSSSTSYREGDKVEARFKGKTRWFKGTIESLNRDGTYDVRYEDGDRERDVIAEYIRSIDGGARRDRDTRSLSPSSSSSYREGDKVEARFKGKTRWFKGTIESVNRDGTYDVRYEDGDREREVIAEYIRSVDGETRNRGGRGDSPRPSSPSSIELGDRIEARFRGKSKWFKGKVEHVNRDGTFDIVYEDGDRERDVVSEHVRRIEHAGRSGASSRPPTRRSTGGSTSLVSSRPSPRRTGVRKRRNSLSTVDEVEATPSVRRPNLSVRTTRTPRGSGRQRRNSG
jgi:hypothetical protein